VELLVAIQPARVEDREGFRLEVRDSLEAEPLTGTEGVPDREQAGVDEPDDVAGEGFLDGLAVGGEEAVRPGQPHGAVQAGMMDQHVLLEPARADPHERQPVAVVRVHVRLNLEDEPRELLPVGRDEAAAAPPRPRRRRECRERPEERLHAEIA
jgi:hypothetical protein